MKIDQSSQDPYCDRAWLNILFYACVMIVPIVFIVSKNGAAWALILVCCIGNCIEASKSKTMEYLKKKKSLSDTQKKIVKCQKKAPKIIWHIQNYHYETRTEHYKDAEGNSKTR